MPSIKRALVGWPIFILSALWLVWFSQTDIAAELHGRIHPVVTPLTVTSVEPATIQGAPAVRIEGFATIERESCDYISVGWYLNGSTRRVSVPAFFSDPAQVRESGRSEWSALMVGVTPEQLGDTRGNVRHECGRFPVLTPFFVPDDSIIPTDAGASAQCHDGAYSTSTGPGTCSGHGGVREWLAE